MKYSEIVSVFCLSYSSCKSHLFCAAL